MLKTTLQQGDTINNAELREIFGCSSRGGMRRSRKTNTLVIVSNHVDSIYEDRWEEGVLHYTGMGQEGDQVLHGNQNKTLNESQINGIGVHLFEVFRDGAYTYQGQVELANDPYQEKQLDSKEQIRDVWIFPVRLKFGGSLTTIPNEDYQRVQRSRQRKISKLSDNELKARLSKKSAKPNKRMTTSPIYSRDQNVVVAALRRAKGDCQLCDQPAPFQKKNKEPFLEVHHVVWIAKGGDDKLYNTVALCPNCHRKMHSLNRKADIDKLTKVAANLGSFG